MKEVVVPVLPESVSDATVAKWHKKVGESFKKGDSLLDLETDKIMLDIPAICDGTLAEILAAEGDIVISNQLLAKISTEVSTNAAKSDDSPISSAEEPATSNEIDNSSSDATHSPAVRKILHANNLNSTDVIATGRDGRLTKTDVENHLKNNTSTNTEVITAASSIVADVGDRVAERVPMTRLRQTIASRLLAAQSNAAILTTFNEVDMQPIMDLRSKYKDLFQNVHDTKLGFMSFFVTAAVAALKKFPDVNASIDGTDIVYHNYFDIGLAVSSARGLVVPIIKNAENYSMAGVEKQIIGYANKAKEGILTLEEMTGGTFTITNGGTFGSMLSTPILNPPQSAILGMHNIVKRAVVVNDEVVVRPMMYLALSYDHRIIDGATSVRFLVTIKELLEDPSRMLLEI
jgi:2-oxoglutarate dehydrogenase E2 component (dihydrolipoamide succinyltransferase)